MDNVDMKTLHNFTYSGKKQHTGGLVTDESGRLYIFVAYCDSCNGKVVMTREEAKTFGRYYHAKQKRFRNRLFQYEIKKRTF